MESEPILEEEGEDPIDFDEILDHRYFSPAAYYPSLTKITSSSLVRLRNKSLRGGYTTNSSETKSIRGGDKMVESALGTINEEKLDEDIKRDDSPRNNTLQDYIQQTII